LYAFDSFKFVGIEIWQVKAGSIYDNFLVTDDADLAKSEAETILKRVQGERDAEAKADEEARAKEAEATADEPEEKDDL